MLTVLALLPVLVALLLLLIFRWHTREVGWMTLSVTIALVSLVPVFHRTPWQIALSLGEGTANVLTAGVVLLPALLFSQMQQQTGAMDGLMQGLKRLVPHRDLATLLLVLGVGPFIEALCGFGTGALLILPLLVRLHQKRLKAVQLSLLSQILVSWEGRGLGTTLTAPVAGLSTETLNLHTALLLFPSAIGLSVLALQISGGRRALKRYGCLAPLAGGLFMLVLCLCSQFFAIEVAGVLASFCVIALLLIWGQIFREAPVSAPSDAPNISQDMRILSALLPSFLLIAGIFATQVVPPISTWLQTSGVLVFPATKVHVALLSLPGVWLLLAALVHIPLFSRHRIHLTHTLEKTARLFLAGVAAMVGFLTTAALMQDSGMTDMLGNAAAMLGKNAVWVAPLFGAFGGWFASGNAWAGPLFGDGSLHLGSSLPWLIAAQNAGASMASVLSPWWVLLLTASAGLLGKEALVFRKMGPMLLWSLALTTLLLVWFTRLSWLGDVIVLFALLLVVNAPLGSTVVGYAGTWLRRSHAISTPLLVPPETRSTQSPRHLAARWTWKWLAYGGLLLVNVLYASYSLVSLSPLKRIDPMLFVCFQMLLLAPFGLVFLLRARKYLNRERVSRGLQLGGFLSAELLCYSHSLQNTGITESMVFSTANGVVATLIAWKIFGQRISTLTKWACLFALGGACLVWYTSPARWQGDFTAFVSGICLTGYAFQVEQLLAKGQQWKQTVQPVMGVQFLTSALVTLVIALCFGQWGTVHLLVPSDLVALVYLSLAAVLLPCFLVLMVQRSVSAVTVAFFSVVEPLVGASLAFFVAGERLSILAYAGAGIVIVGIVLQVVGETVKHDADSASSDLAVSLSP